MTSATNATAVVDKCVMCGARLLPRPHGHALVCGSAHCARRLALMPPHQKCGVCGRPLSVAQWSGGVCSTESCRTTKLVRQPLAAAAARFAEDMLVARKRRRLAAARRGLSPAEQSSYLIAILPRNSDRSSRLPQARRDAFASHLRANLAAARARLATSAAVTPVTPSMDEVQRGNRSDEEIAAEQALLGKGCAACRGDCCRSGGDHAYNDAGTMTRYLETSPHEDDDTIVARYVSYFATKTMTHGCVYQHAEGCTLPRELRSDLCNRFYCGGISVLRNQFAAGDPVRAYMIHRNRHDLFDGQFVEIPTSTARASREEPVV